MNRARKDIEIVQDLVLLILGNGEPIRCSSLDDALAKAIFHKGKEGRIRVEVTPAGGGRMTVLDFDRDTLDWIPSDSIE
jgi:hypothetical protein